MVCFNACKVDVRLRARTLVTALMAAGASMLTVQ